MPKKFCANCYEELTNDKFMYCFECNQPTNKVNYDSCIGVKADGSKCNIKCYYNYCYYHKSQKASPKKELSPIRFLKPSA